MDFFDNREKLKAEFGEYYEKSLKKKWGPGTPETTTNTTYQQMLAIVIGQTLWSLNGPPCCGDSPKIEVNRSIPELKSLSVYTATEGFFRTEGFFSMRLTQLLMMWPKKRPNGNIWIGKNQL